MSQRVDKDSLKSFVAHEIENKDNPLAQFTMLEHIVGEQYGYFGMLEPAINDLN